MAPGNLAAPIAAELLLSSPVAATVKASTVSVTKKRSRSLQTTFPRTQRQLVSTLPDLPASLPQRSSRMPRQIANRTTLSDATKKRSRSLQICSSGNRRVVARGETASFLRLTNPATTRSTTDHDDSDEVDLSTPTDAARALDLLTLMSSPGCCSMTLHSGQRGDSTTATDPTLETLLLPQYDNRALAEASLGLLTSSTASDYGM